MSNADFARCLARVLVYEGGKVDNPKDPGGRTNLGITQNSYNAYRRENDLSLNDVCQITNDEAGAIYKEHYWDAIKGDDLPAGLDLAVFDGAVNSGVGRAGTWLQQALGSKYGGKQDGMIGSKVLQAIADYDDDEELINAFCARRLGTLKRLKTFATFGKGWTARIANCQKIADSWCAVEPVAPASVDVSSLMGHRKANIDDDLVSPPVSPIVTHVVTGAGSIGAVASQTATQLSAVGTTWQWLTYACAGLSVLGVIAGVIVKFGTDATSAADAGSAIAKVDPDANSQLPTVIVTDPKVDASEPKTPTPVTAPTADPTAMPKS